MSLTNAKFVCLALAATFVAGAAQAQTMATSVSSFETGYGLTRGEMENPISVSTRDANGNLLMLDGEIMTGTDQSVYAYSKTLGAGDTYAGAGAVGGATAVGNNLQVIVNGSYNTVIVHSTQTNNGNVTATSNGTTATGLTGTATAASSLNGQVKLNGF